MMNSKELSVYVNILRDLNDGNKLSYNELTKQLLIEFGVKATIEDLMRVDEPTFIDEAIDKQIMYKNIN